VKKSLILILLICAILSIFSWSWGKKSSKTIELKIGHFDSEGGAGNIACKQFAAAVEKRTNGAVTIKIYPNNELGAPPEVLEQNILGAIDMSLPTQGQLAKYSKKFGCVMMPFVYKSREQAWRVLDGPFMKWAAPDLEKQGLVFLSNWEWGFRNLTNSVRPVNTPEDVKGLKIRTPPELSNVAAMEALGGIVQQIAFTELPMALKQGVVDGQENPVATIYNFKIYETQKYLAMTGHTYNSMVNVISKKSFDKLSRSQQRIVREESKKAGDYMRKTLADAEKDYIKKLEDKGMEVTYPDVSKFKTLMGPAYKRMEASVGSDNAAEFLKMVESTK
jgi:tripartite ATP-independent transporter DctP family solute receptor